LRWSNAAARIMKQDVPDRELDDGPADHRKLPGLVVWDSVSDCQERSTATIELHGDVMLGAIE
jgi:hypothetical protein